MFDTDRVTLEVLSPYPALRLLATYDINPRVTAITIETGPGGFGRMQAGFSQERDGTRVYAFLPEPVEIVDMAHLRVRLGGGIVWEGVLQRALPNGLGIEGLGYGPAAGSWKSLSVSGTGDVTAGELATLAIAAVPWWTPGQIVDSGVRHLWTDVAGRDPGEVLDQLAQEGGVPGGQALSVPWFFAVYEGQLASFTPQVPPAVAQHILSYDPAAMDLGWDYSAIRDALRAQYTTASASTMTPWFYRSGVDKADPYLREQTIAGAVDTPDAAMRVAQTQLASIAAPQLTGQVTFRDGEHIGARAGEWVEMDTERGRALAMITQTSANYWTGETQLTLGEPSRATPLGMWKALARAERGLRRKTDPVTGAPLRLAPSTTGGS